MVTPLGRIVEITEEGRHLVKDRGYLVVQAGREEAGRVPLDGLMAVIATARGTSVSDALLTALAERGVRLWYWAPTSRPPRLSGRWRDTVPCPVAWRRRSTARAQWKKRLWQQIVAVKICRQGWALRRAGAPSGAFGRLARLVQPGDPENMEAQTARR